MKQAWEKGYFKRTRQEHDACRTRDLYEKLEKEKAALEADSYMLPLESVLACARIQPGIEYKVIFRCKDEVVVFLLKNRIDADMADVIGSFKEFTKITVVTKPTKKSEVAHVTVQSEPEKVENETAEPEPVVNSEEVLAQTAKDWWKNYSERIWAELEVMGDEPITLGKDYRLPCVEILPYLDRLIRKESDGYYGFDSIDEDLIGTIAPVSESDSREQPQKPKEEQPEVMQQGTKPTKLSQVEKFNQRQMKKAQ